VDAQTFEFQLSVPRDAQVAAVIRMMAEQAARYCGCHGPRAEAFGGKVEEAVRAHLNGASSTGSIAVVVRRSTGPLEVHVETRTIALDL
jgi:4-hydroxyphenylpyruvate dioxygenase-like putative hemolysin